MSKVGVLLLADTGSADGMGRMANALSVAAEFKEDGDEVALIFDGAGTKWVGELSDESHKYHRQFEQVRDSVSGACAYCARAFGVTEKVEASGVPLLDEYRGHPSVKTLMRNGYEVLTF